ARLSRLGRLRSRDVLTSASGRRQAKPRAMTRAAQETRARLSRPGRLPSCGAPTSVSRTRRATIRVV
ncbi:MAG TPA: hypothetical protein VFV01_07785, partial [Spirillospora sp.]|nr:hypothetical protein [Spirillospora sp.]